VKAQADIIVGIVYFFVFILVLWIFTLIFQTSLFGNPQVTNSLNPGHNANVTGVFAGTSGFFTGINTIAAFLYIFIAIGAVVAAAFTESHPVFAVMGILLLPVELVFSFGFHDAFFSVIANSAFSPLVAQYPFVVTTFTYLPIITLVMAILVLIATFAKSD
jgi:hypothetical protein